MKENITVNEQRFLSLLRNSLFQIAVPMELFRTIKNEDWEYLFTESVIQQMEVCIWESINRLNCIHEMPKEVYQMWEKYVYQTLYRKEVYLYCLMERNIQFYRMRNSAY